MPYALSMPFAVTSTDVEPPLRTSRSGSREAAYARSFSFFEPSGSHAALASTGACWPRAEKVTWLPRSSTTSPQVLASHRPSERAPCSSTSLTCFRTDSLRSSE